MKVRAKVNFGGELSMHAGEVRDVREGEVLRDLLSAGYVEAMEAEPPKRKGKRHENQ